MLDEPAYPRHIEIAEEALDVGNKYVVAGHRAHLGSDNRGAAGLGQVARLPGARELMGYCGAVPSENSSGERTRRGSITKTSNAHLRHIVVEAA